MAETCSRLDDITAVTIAPPTRSQPMKREQSRAGVEPSTSHLAGRIPVTDVEVQAL